MHRRLAMRPTDLAELYSLLHMYIRTYEAASCSDAGALLALIQSHYEEQASLATASSFHAGPLPSLHNPRGAGRKPFDSDSMKVQAASLRQSGLSIRAVASTLHCSIGYIHKLIHEQNRKSPSCEGAPPHAAKDNQTAEIPIRPSLNPRD